MKLNRGDIYYIHFPQTFDPVYIGGKGKFVVVLQSGENFEKYRTVTVDNVKDFQSTAYLMLKNCMRLMLSYT